MFYRGSLPMLQNAKLYMCPRDNPNLNDTNRFVTFSSYMMNAAVCEYTRECFPA